METTGEVAISQAITLLVTAKRLANRRPRYVKSLEQLLRLFARGRETRPIREFDINAIEDWLAKRTDSLQTRVGNVGRLSSLFSFAVRRKWIPENPCDQLEQVHIEPSIPRILTPDESERLMRWAQFQKPDSVGYFAKALFVGIRPEETEKLEADRIQEDKRLIVIDAAASKVRNRRIVTITDTAAEWLAEARRLGCLCPFSRATRRRWIRDAREHLGFTTWPQDVLRHSAASYLMATFKDAGQVATMLGNSSSILLRHYRELVTEENAVAFWAIRP